MLSLDKLNQETIKNNNRNKVLNLILKKREMTKQEISRELRLSLPTVNTCVSKLIENGLVEEAGVAKSIVGRKPVIVKFMPDSRYSFGVDISPKKVRILLVNLDTQIETQTSFNLDIMESFETIMDKISFEINKIIEDRSIPKNKLLGIGFSLPGAVDENDLVLYSAPNLKIDNLDLKKYVDMFDIPIYIENEANAAAYAESVLGIAKEMSNLVYVSITEGIGTGIIIQNYLYKGKNRVAGKFGHIRTGAEGRICNCGREDCWELYASEKSLLDDFNKNSIVKVNDVIEILEMYKTEEKYAMEIVDNYLNHLARGIQNIILVLDPHYVIVGGENLSNYEEILLQPLKEKIFGDKSFNKTGGTKILFSSLKKDASIIGAALLPLQSVFSINNKII